MSSLYCPRSFPSLRLSLTFWCAAPLSSVSRSVSRNTLSSVIQGFVVDVVSIRAKVYVEDTRLQQGFVPGCCSDCD